MAFVMAVSLYTTRVVLNALGASDYGIFNVVCGFVSLFGFLNTSMTNAIQRFYNYELGRKEGNLSTVYNSALIVQIAIALAIIIVVETFGVWYLNNKLIVPGERLYEANVLFQFAVIQLFFSVIAVPYSAVIVAYEKMDYYALVSIIDVVIKLIIVLILPHVNFDKLLFYGFLLTIVGGVNFLLYYVYAKKNFECIQVKRLKNYKVLKSILSFSGWNVFGTLAFMMKNQGLAVVLNLIFGTLINAAYGISNQVMGAIKQFSLNIILAFKPQLVQSYAAGEYNKTLRLMYAMTKISYLMLFAISLPVIIEMDAILGLWLGNVPEHTTNLTRLAIVSMLLSNFHTPLVQVVHAVGKQKLFQIFTSIIIFCIVPISYLILLCDASPENIYWVTIILVLINQCACLYALRKVFTFSLMEYLKEAVLPCFILSCTSIIIPICSSSWIIVKQPLLHVTIVSAISVISVLFCSYIFALNNMERGIIKDFVKTKLNHNKR